MFKVNIAELRHKIEIQEEATIGKDDYGNDIKDWIKFKCPYAKIMNLYGDGLYSAQAVDSKVTVKFLIRYKKGITTDMRVEFQGKFYNIKFTDNVEYKNQWLFLKCEVIE